MSSEWMKAVPTIAKGGRLQKSPMKAFMVLVMNFTEGSNRAVEKGGQTGALAPTHHFFDQKFFFLIKLENIKYLYVNNM